MGLLPLFLGVRFCGGGSPQGFLVLFLTRFVAPFLAGFSSLDTLLVLFMMTSIVFFCSFGFQPSSSSRTVCTIPFLEFG